ncbi:MAG: fibronectin type III domain-containing protein, partial [Aquimonas sp.]|nr:fibronectin type III domain-containing protein [Aquimonas sp.]
FQGSAYVFMRSGGTWTQASKLTAGDGAANDQFGTSVALDGDTALVGASYDDVGANSDQGSAYVFTRSGSSWTQEAKLTAGDGAAYDNFGYSVSLNGDTALVGAYGDDVGVNSQQGSAYVFTRSGSIWTQETKLTAGDAAASDNFGYSVSLNGDTALVGAFGDNSNQGSTYVFTRSGSTWTQEEKLVAGDGAASGGFGRSVALSSTTALVGAPYVDGLPPYGNPDEGAAYVFNGVGLPSQTISFANPGPQAFGSTPTLSATASSGLTVVFSSATPSVCSITAGGTLTFLLIGTCTINADQPGDANFAAAETVPQSFAVDAVVPGAPTLGTATAGDGQASVSFVAPSFTGGASITGYTVTSTPDGLTGTGADSPITVSGLTNGVAYTFSVTATNSVGTGPASESSNSVTPTANQTITFANPGSQAFGTTPTRSATASSGLPVVYSSATTGVCTISEGGTLSFIATGTCTIHADQAGNAAFNPSPTVPQSFAVDAVAPAAPMIGTATAGDGQASVSFVAPSFTGGAPILGYTVTSNPAGLTGTGAASPISVTGLSNGVAYTFSVTATNSAGTGPASAATNEVTPRGPQATLTAIATPATVAFGATSTLSTTGGSGRGAVSYAVTAGGSNCSITESTLNANGVGTCTVTATKAEEGAFTAATATVEVTVSKADQAALTATATPSTIVFGGSSTLGTTGGSGTGLVTFAVTSGSTVCEVSGSTLNATGVGTCTVTATKAGDTNYNEATATVDVVVFGRDLSALGLSVGTLSPAFDPAQLNYAAAVANNVTSLALTASLQDANASLQVNGNAAVSGEPVSVPVSVGVNTISVAVIAVDSSVRTYSLSMTRRDAQLINFPAIADKVLGDADFTVAVSGGGSGEPVVLTTGSPSVCDVSGLSVQLIAAGECELLANQAGNATYDAADEVSRRFAVQPGADLQISKSNGVEGLSPQAPVVYSIEVGNAGPSAVVGAALVDTLPAELIDAQWVCTSIQNATCPVASGSGSINVLVDLPVNGILRFDLSAELSAAPGAFITNAASISVPSGTVERDPSNNSASDTDTVLPFGVFANGFEEPLRGITVPRL